MSHILHRIVKNNLRTIDHKKSILNKAFLSQTIFPKVCCVQQSETNIFQVNRFTHHILGRTFQIVFLFGTICGFLQSLDLLYAGFFPRPVVRGTVLRLLPRR